MTLALLLFADASTLDFGRVRHDARLPVRLLGVGLPLTIILGAVIALVLFPAQGLGFALLVASILAPTDAALGLPIFTNPNVPIRIRRALNIESGLNDGMATPFVTLFIALAVAEESATLGGGWLTGALIQIGLAVVVGVVVGVVGGKHLSRPCANGRGAPLQFAVLALALGAYLGSFTLGGNGFVAAFVAGNAFGAATRHELARKRRVHRNDRHVPVADGVDHLWRHLRGAGGADPLYDLAGGGVCAAEPDGDPHAARCPGDAGGALSRPDTVLLDGLVWSTAGWHR